MEEQYVNKGSLRLGIRDSEVELPTRKTLHTRHMQQELMFLHRKDLKEML
jgi:hypothetical protein